VSTPDTLTLLSDWIDIMFTSTLLGAAGVLALLLLLLMVLLYKYKQVGHKTPSAI
jgi:hypothetical protein